ncbi:UDP-N-acetylglucosamine 2-epimerase (non-hydrolyzing) [Enterococcus casseliflavus]|uniref:non-hydrolyzing UDP-N-acetylglucosamine 2-epimerase n=1 Tax=Enterococcus casseliflavus TaxID=37734 RepID=UPI0022557573|nr:UDP-N-acetylglucosamine 2-epimerase (non-hydrolyzing) [Enterococcus casseliflavus]MCX4167992.1 UDP-N-acetylglucosamine 2-epimerase (non-hydrolyzing) [Enterococcus casseliflavus]
MQKIRVMTIFGTRPEAIKMAPLVKAIEKDNRFESIVTVTAQHRQMLDQVLNIFEIKANYDLNIMKDGQSLSGITSRVIKELDRVFENDKPDVVLVHGDTTTTFSASIASFYHQIKIGHVEAGLRTWNKYSPFPEEINRQLTDVISDIYFAPTETSKENLLSEKRDAENIFVTGNTAIDAMKYTISDDFRNDLLDEIGENKIVLVTMHRRENLGQPMINVFKALNKIVEMFDNVHVVFPMHKNPKVREIAKKCFLETDRVHLIEPLDVVDFQNLANNSYMIMSDSGGVQEEAPSLGKPVLVLRDTTERPEGIEAGTLKLVGTDENEVFETAKILIEDENLYSKMSKASNPYGDGKASERILDAIAYHFGVSNSRPSEF